MNSRILYAPLLLVLLVTPLQAQQLRVFISVDMEGITGLVHGDQVSSDGKDYQMARRWMTEEANAAVQGALDAGATEVVVNDSHGSMRNLILADLHPSATLITGSPKPLSMMQGIDATFGAVVFVGYHASEGTTDAVLDHTISGGTVASIKVNGIEMPELGLNALLAGKFNVPVVFISGDKAVCEQAKNLLGSSVVTVAVKEGIGKRAAKTIPLKKAHELIRQNVKNAVERRTSIKPYTMKSPYTFELTFFRSSQADQAAVIPGARRLNTKTLSLSSQDAVEGFMFLRGLIMLGSN
ncbi:MAG: M55 family metallopeptidase [Bacteroidota bacterium]